MIKCKAYLFETGKDGEVSEGITVMLPFEAKIGQMFWCPDGTPYTIKEVGFEWYANDDDEYGSDVYEYVFAIIAVRTFGVGRKP